MTARPRAPPRSRGAPTARAAPAARPSTSTPTRSAPTACSSPASWSRRRRRPGSGRSRSPTTTSSPATASWSRRRRATRRRRSSSSRASRSTRSPRASPAAREGELHILGFGDGSRTTTAFEAALAGQRDRAGGPASSGWSTRLRELGLPIDDQIAPCDLTRRRRARPADDRAGADRRRLCDERRGRVRAADRLRAARRTCRARGWGRARRSTAIRAAGGVPVLAHFSEAPGADPPLLRELRRWGLARPRGLLPRASTRRRSTAVGAVARELGLLATGGTDYHGDTGTYAEAHAALWVPRRGRGRLAGAIAAVAGAAGDHAGPMTRPRRSRALPVLDVAPPARASRPRRPPARSTTALAEYLPETPRAAARSTSGRSAAR